MSHPRDFMRELTESNWFNQLHEKSTRSKDELPELPTPLGPWHATSDDSGYYTYTAEQMTAYGEDCRRMGNRDE